MIGVALSHCPVGQLGPPTYQHALDGCTATILTPRTKATPSSGSPDLAGGRRLRKLVPFAPIALIARPPMSEDTGTESSNMKSLYSSYRTGG